MSDDKIDVDPNTKAFLEMEYGVCEDVVESHVTRLGLCVQLFLEAYSYIPFIMSMCSDHHDTGANRDEAIIDGVFWVKSPNAVFCSVECAQMFTSIGREDLGRLEWMCDTCGGLNDNADTRTTVIAIGKTLIISDSCSACLETDPALVADSN